MDALTWPPTEMLMLLLAASAPADASVRCWCRGYDEQGPTSNCGLSNVFAVERKVVKVGKKYKSCARFHIRSSLDTIGL